MNITDGQVHVWPANTPERPWTSDGLRYAHWGDRAFTAEDLTGRMDAAGVSSAFLVAPTWDRYRNDVVLAAASADADRFAVVARLDLSHPDPDQVRAWHQDPRVVGVRTVFLRDTEGWLRDGTADWFWPVAEAVGMPVMIYAPYQCSGIRSLAERHPGLRLTLCHLGLDTRIRDDAILAEIDDLLPLACLPNVAVKATSLPSFVSDDYPFSSLHPIIERVTDVFGPQRVFWGSDLSRLRCSYRQLVDLFLSELSFLDDAALTWIMGRGIREWFHWHPGGSAEVLALGG